MRGEWVREERGVGEGGGEWVREERGVGEGEEGSG